MSLNRSNEKLLLIFFQQNIYKKEEKDNLSTIEDNMKQIKGALEKEIKIEIYFKIGEPITLEGNLRKQEKQEYIINDEKYLLRDSDNNESSIKENNYQSCNNNIYYSARK